MPFFSPFLERFRRVTSSGSYLPEVDGLRFIAIFLVAFLLHMGTYIHGHVLHLDTMGLLYGLCWNGDYGVTFFLSSVVLFCHYLLHGNIFLRRKKLV